MALVARLVWPPVAGGRRRPAVATVGLAILAAFAFTVPARAWMRLISSDPDFTWSGTLGIALGFAILFTGAALNLAARRNGWSRRATWVVRVLGAVLILPAFGGAGLLVLPTAVLGGIAIARPDWRLARVPLALLAVAGLVIVATTIPGDGLAAGRAALGIVLLPAFVWPLILAARLPFVPRTSEPEV